MKKKNYITNDITKNCKKFRESFPFTACSALLALKHRRKPS